MKLKKKERNEIFQAVGLLTQIGFNMAACIIISVLIGRFIDDKLSTTPVFILIFTLLGVMASFRSLYLIVKKKL